jgi:moderate conductance mechanosensitive channel
MEEKMRTSGFIERLLNAFSGQDFSGPVIAGVKVLGIIVLAALLVKTGSFIIKKVLEKRKKFRFAADSKRVDTLATLLVSIYRYGIYLIAGLIILSDVFALKSVLAAAGVGGIAVGLGAQSLIRDIISGFFILMEDQFAVGDLITIDSMNGTVEEMELRITKLRNFNGDLYVIPNGEIKKVVNHTRGNKAVIVDIPVAYSADMSRVFEIASKVCAESAAEIMTLVEAPQVLGITELGKDTINLRIFARAHPNEQWQAEREIRRRVKEAFDREGIEFTDKNRLITEFLGRKGEGTDA